MIINFDLELKCVLRDSRSLGVENLSAFYKRFQNNEEEVSQAQELQIYANIQI